MRDNVEIKIIDQLISSINNSEYHSDDKLPSENELANKYGVPRIVARKAYETLEEMGYIYSKQGKGRFLRYRHEPIDLFLSGKQSFSEKMIEKGYDFVSRNIFFRQIKYDEKIFKELDAGIQDKIYELGRLRIISGIPMALHISYVSAATFPDIEKTGHNISSMFNYYRSNGYKEFSSTKSILSVAFPGEEERNILNCSSLVPLLVLETNSIDVERKKILESTKILYRSDHFKYIIQ